MFHELARGRNPPRAPPARNPNLHRPELMHFYSAPLMYFWPGVDTRTRYVVYRSIQPDWWDSIDMADALHPQTLVTLSMNGGELPVPFGGPVRLRVPRQLGYKNIKYITRLTLTDNLRQFGKGLGSGIGGTESGYAWYAGI